MKVTWATVVALGLVWAAAAGAQSIPTTPRAMGMGNAVIGVADDGGAWAQNPAGLGALHVRTYDEKTFGNDLIAGLGEAGGDSALGINWSGWNPSTQIGFGAGYNDMGDASMLGAAFGMGHKDSPFSWGADIMRVEIGNESDTVFDLGAMYRVVRPGMPSTRVGLKISDIASSTDDGLQVGMGVSWTATENLLVAIDVVDVTGQTASGPFFNGGVEYKLGDTKQWCARGGAFDTGDGHKLTLGVGIVLPKVRLDLAYMNTDNSTWMVGAGIGF